MKLYRPYLRKPASSQLAFTLIETAVAVCILLVVFTTIFATVTMGLSITQASRENLRATQIMLDKMEGIRLYNWTQLTNGNYLQSSFTNWFFETNNIGATAASGNGVMYTGSVAVTFPATMPAIYSNSMRVVTVTVGWASQSWVIGASNHVRTMTTFASQMGMQNYIFNN
jgi:type II secretory pathway pseudopilin PulG